MGEHEYTCCICGKHFVGWGNDPWPVDMRDNVECCNACNNSKVLPARLQSLYKNGKEN